MEKLNQIQAAISNLRGLNLQHCTSDDIRAGIHLFFLTLSELKRQLVYLNMSQVWHRGRKLEDGKPFDLLEKMIYPPPENTPLGRANSKGKPVFYASRNRGTALSELDVQSGDVVQVIRCRVKEGLIVKADLLGEFEHVFKSGISLIGYDKSVEFVRSLLATLPLQESLALLLIDAFLADCFRKRFGNTYEYKLTSAWAEVRLSAPCEAFMYPSVEHVGGLNVAVPTAIFDKKFEVLGSEVMEVVALGYGLYRTEIQATSSNIVDGKFVWESLPHRPRIIEIAP